MTGARVGRPLPKHFPTLLTCVADIGRRDGTEGDHIHRLDLDLPVADPVATSNLDLGAAPETERDRDVSRQHPFSQLRTELHVPRDYVRSTGDSGGGTPSLESKSLVAGAES